MSWVVSSYVTVAGGSPRRIYLHACGFLYCNFEVILSPVHVYVIKKRPLANL